MRLLCLILCLSLTLVHAGEEKRAMTFEDMFTMKRVSQLDVSPDGNRVLFRVKQANIEANGYSSGVFLLDLKTGQVTRMTDADLKASGPVWRPDGQAFAYASGGQIFVKSLDGSTARQVTRGSLHAGSPRFSSDGKWLLFTGTVPHKEKEDHSGRVLDALFFRQWNAWVDDVRQHVFVVSAEGERNEARDLTPGDADAPPLDLGSSHDYTFSPDGKEVAFVKNPDEVVATSTNNDVFVVPLDGGKEKRITPGNGRDAEPVYSPDGRYLAYGSMERPGFEADRIELKIYDRKSGKHTSLTAKMDHSVGNIIWAPDSKSLFYTTNVAGTKSIFTVDLKGKGRQLTDKGTIKNLGITGSTLVFTLETTTQPAEIYTMSLDKGKPEQRTFLNKPVLDQLAMNDWEEFWFDSPNGAKVQGFVIKPPFFDENKKYPMIYLIHGGPQGMWGDLFHYRWNSQMFAAPGNVVVLVNPHGSKGYGQKFCDAVTRDWGGLPYKDLMKGLDESLERFPYIDRNRLGAAGASYGGYMINWIATHENPFKAMVSHNGLFNIPSMAGSTEELWFTEWEFGGSYYEHPELYEKWSPHHRANKMKTPMLVIHSEFDFRVPVNQGIELFTALQRQGIPSRWLYFPDEDHFVTAPKNAKKWWGTVFHWFDLYLNRKTAQGS